VRFATDGAEALERIAEQTPDVLLLDLLMPIMSGWEVLRSQREASFAIPVLVISALADRSAPYQIAKPISVDQLLKLVDAVAGGRRRAESGGSETRSRERVLPLGRCRLDSGLIASHLHPPRDAAQRREDANAATLCSAWATRSRPPPTSSPPLRTSRLRST
jgi:DNA-binding response OmpR family regulator